MRVSVDGDMPDSVKNGIFLSISFAIADKNRK